MNKLAKFFPTYLYIYKFIYKYRYINLVFCIIYFITFNDFFFRWYKLISDCIQAEAPHKSRPKFPYDLHSDIEENKHGTSNTPSSEPQEVHDSIFGYNNEESNTEKLNEESISDNVENNETSTSQDSTLMQNDMVTPDEHEKEAKNGENVLRQNPTFNMRILTQCNSLICPSQVKVSTVSNIYKAEPVLTIFGKVLLFLLIVWF